MVNPTPQPLTGNADGLRLQAVNSETLRYLGQQVGKVIEARVIQVITQLPGASDNANVNAKTDNANIPAAGRSDASRPSANPAERYQLLLSIDNQRSIKVESSLAPRIGQLLQLAVIDNQQLRIVNPGSPTATAIAGAPTQALPGQSAAAKLASHASDASLKTDQLKAGLNLPPAPSVRSASASENAAARAGAALGQALRDALPRQTSRAELPAALAQLATATPTAVGSRAGSLAQLPTQTATLAATQAATQAATSATTGNSNPLASANARAGATNSAQGAAASSPPAIAAPTTATLPTAVQAAAQQLANAIPQASALGDPAQLRVALLNSGVFYERKLADFVAQQRTLQNALQNAGKTTANSATPNPRPVASNPTTAPLALDARARSELDTRLQGDIKGHVLTLARELKAALPATALPPMQHSSGARSAELHGDPRSDLSLANLWQVINTAHGAVNQTANTRLDPVMQLLRLALGNGAHIQAQQLLAAGSQFASQSDPQLNQTLNLELPLWLDQRLAMVDVRVEREKASRNSPDTIATWNVRLRFDLEELGELTALATLQGKRMAAVMWASDADLTQKIQHELAAVASQLGELGLDVQHLLCRTGPAPEASAHSTINVLTMNLLDTQS